MYAGQVYSRDKYLQYRNDLKKQMRDNNEEKTKMRLNERNIKSHLKSNNNIKK